MPRASFVFIDQTSLMAYCQRDNEKKLNKLSGGLLSLQMSLQFSYYSEFDGRVEELFAWHEEEGAIERLSPPWQSCEVVKKTGGLEVGGEVLLYLKKGIFGQFWKARHTAYQKNAYFADVQDEGPFKSWHHRHVFEERGEQRARLRDDVVYELPWSSVSHRVARKFAEQQLVRLFRYRHQMTKRDFAYYQKRDPQHAGKRVLISGGSGFIGKRLTDFLRMMGYDVWILSRKAGDKRIVWDIEKGVLAPESLENFHAIIHLAGESIAQRWTPEVKRRIVESRVKGTKLLVKTLAEVQKKPVVFICASGINFYGYEQEQICTEESTAGRGFLSEVVEAWEASARPVEDLGIRLCLARTGVVLHPQGGALAKMWLPFSLGLGGPIGQGKRKLSWIGLDDLVYAYYHLLKTDTVSGAVNLVAPGVATNQAFTDAFADALRRPAIFPLPPSFLRLALGEMAKETILCDLQVSAQKLLDSGFTFSGESVEKELAFLFGRP